MLRHLKLGAKLNLILGSMFIVVVISTGVWLSTILENNAERVITDTALLLIETMKSVRTYTNTQVNPELASRLETEQKFLPQTVPAYSAREVFEELRKKKEYRDFFYKEATINPTNPRDKADLFETTVVEAFRSQPELPEKTGFRSLDGQQVFYIARPISVSKESCLRCHSTPDIAPKSQLLTYGDQNGFGWKLNEIVSVQIISVPASKIFNEARNLQILVLSILGGFFILLLIVINIFLKTIIANPLKQMSQIAQRISDGDLSSDFPAKSNDEIGFLAVSLNKVKSALLRAMSNIKSG